MIWIVLVCLIWLILFQILLAAGAPLGHLAWGGAHRVLPRSLRLASGISAAALCLALAAVCRSAGWIGWPPEGMLRPLLAGFAALFGLSLLGNLASKSRVERWHGVPLTAILCLGLAALAWDA